LLFRRILIVFELNSDLAINLIIFKSAIYTNSKKVNERFQKRTQQFSGRTRPRRECSTNNISTLELIKVYLFFLTLIVSPVRGNRARNPSAIVVVYVRSIYRVHSVRKHLPEICRRPLVFNFCSIINVVVLQTLFRVRIVIGTFYFYSRARSSFSAMRGNTPCPGTVREFRRGFKLTSGRPGTFRTKPIADDDKRRSFYNDHVLQTRTSATKTRSLCNRNTVTGRSQAQESHLQTAGERAFLRRQFYSAGNFSSASHPNGESARSSR